MLFGTWISGKYVVLSWSTWSLWIPSSIFPEQNREPCYCCAGVPHTGLGRLSEVTGRGLAWFRAPSTVVTHLCFQVGGRWLPKPCSPALPLVRPVLTSLCRVKWFLLLHTPLGSCDGPSSRTCHISVKVLFICLALPVDHESLEGGAMASFITLSSDPSTE